MAHVFFPQHGGAGQEIDLSGGFEVAVEGGRVIIQTAGHDYSGTRRVWAVPQYDGVLFQVRPVKPVI